MRQFFPPHFPVIVLGLAVLSNPTTALTTQLYLMQRLKKKPMELIRQRSDFPTTDKKATKQIRKFN